MGPSAYIPTNFQGAGAAEFELVLTVLKDDVSK